MGADRLSQDRCNINPTYSTAVLSPQYFPLHVRRLLDQRLLVFPSHAQASQRYPNYAPGASLPLFGNVSDHVIYMHSPNLAVCRGSSLIENCMVDRFSINFEPKYV